MTPHDDTCTLTAATLRHLVLCTGGFSAGYVVRSFAHDVQCGAII